MSGTDTPVSGTDITSVKDWYPLWGTGIAQAMGKNTASVCYRTNIDQYYWLVYNCQSNQYCLYHWSVRTIMYVQLHNICQSV